MQKPWLCTLQRFTRIGACLLFVEVFTIWRMGSISLRVQFDWEYSLIESTVWLRVQFDWEYSLIKSAVWLRVQFALQNLLFLFPIRSRPPDRRHSRRPSFVFEATRRLTIPHVGIHSYRRQQREARPALRHRLGSNQQDLSQQQAHWRSEISRVERKGRPQIRIFHQGIRPLER